MAVSLGPTTASENVPAIKTSEVSGLLYKLQNQFTHLLADQVTPLRLAGHLSVLVVGAVILILSQIQLPDWNISLDALPNNALGGAQAAITVNPQQLEASNAVGSEGMQEALQRAAVPFTTAQEQPRATIELYTVKAGDTVLGIAARFGIQPETIMWANTEIEQNPDRLAIGDRLNILPVNGVLHLVRQGDTLSSLAAKYKVEVDKIISYTGNGLATAEDQLTLGSQLVIPDGTKPFVAAQVPASFVGPAPSDAVKGSGLFSWPTSGSISQRYWGGHRAIDIGSWVGAPVKSTDSGYVVLAGGGWNGGYGNHVIIDHGNGYSSLYAHLNSIFVRPGESVSRGQQIGTVGNTGNSTGPHLHFEIRYQGVARNPLNWLP
jgi:murein DD-endopeptidase MepM/ murein hydrolase activator NlpD